MPRAKPKGATAEELLTRAQQLLDKQLLQEFYPLAEKTQALVDEYFRVTCGGLFTSAPTALFVGFALALALNASVWFCCNCDENSNTPPPKKGLFGAASLLTASDFEMLKEVTTPFQFVQVHHAPIKSKLEGVRPPKELTN